MLTTQNIKEQIGAMPPAQQLEELGRMLLCPGLTPSEQGVVYARMGQIYWSLDRRGEALSAYEKGAQLDPEGPAALLLAHTNDIMRFFNPDLLNP